jgi:hypothetical protein
MKYEHLHPGAPEHNIEDFGLNSLEVMCAKMHYRKMLQDYEKPEWFKYLGLYSETQRSIVRTARDVLKRIRTMEDKALMGSR